MDSLPPTYLYVGNSPPTHIPNINVSGPCPVVDVIPSIRELFIALNDRAIVDLRLLIDVSEIAMLRGLGIIEVCQTVSTLVDSHRVTCGLRLQRTHTSMAIAVDTDLTIVRELISLNINCFCTIGRGVSELEQDVGLAKWMMGSPHIPSSLKDRLYPPIHTRGDHIKLTPRQAQIFQLIVTRGADNKTLARITNTSVGTIKLHLSAIYKKYAVRNRTQLVVATKGCM